MIAVRRWLRSAALCCAACCMIAVAPGDPGARGPALTQATLPDGLRVIVVEDRSVPVVQTSVWYRFGSLDERPGDDGLAHALEHMMFRGTPSLSAAGLDVLAARMGARLDAETSYDDTHFYWETTPRELPVVLAVEADRMQHLSLAPDQWVIERKAVLDEIDGDMSSPFFNLMARVRAALFPDSPYGRTPLGVRADVARASVNELRRYYDEYYGPNDATLVIAGDVAASRALALARAAFAGVPARPIPARRPPVPPIPARGVHVSAQFPFPFDVVDLAYAVPGDAQPGEPAIATWATLIGLQEGPFYQALVRSGIALALEAQEDTQLHGGILHVFIVLTPGRSPQEARAVFQGVMDGLITGGISRDLAQAAVRMTLAQRRLAADSIAGLGDLVGYTYGIVGERVRDEDERIAAVTAATLRATAERVLASPAVIGELSPNDRPPARSSSKTGANATDDFTARVPAGPIVVPRAWMRTASAASPVRGVLHPIAFTLPNGLHVLFQRKTDTPAFVLRGTIASSPAFDPRGRTGIAQLASEVADDGSLHYSFDQRRRLTDAMGAYVTTGQTFFAEAPARDFERVLAILADGEMHPSFPSPWLEVVRAQTAESIAATEHISGVLARQALERMLFRPDDPSLRLPRRSDVEAIDREALSEYVRDYWRPDLTTIAIVGDLDAAAVRAAVEADFGGWSASGPRPSLALPPLLPPHAARAAIATDAAQVSVRLALPALGRRDPDFPALRLLAEILGGPGDYASRLFQDLRERRGLVYAVSCSLQAEADRGYLTIDFSTAPQHVRAALALIRDQLRALRRAPPSDREIAWAKSRLIAQTVLDEGSASGQADLLLAIVRDGLPLDADAALERRIAGISRSDLLRVARRYLYPDDLAKVFIGPPGPWSQSEGTTP